MPMTVWYRISDPDFPHCQANCVLVDGLEQADAERVARGFYTELHYILGDSLNVQVWAD